MADHPGAKESTTGDRTSALVAGGLALLAALGVGTIFSETIAAAWAPPASAPAAAGPAGGTPAPSPSAAPSRQAGNAALSTSPDGGVAPP